MSFVNSPIVPILSGFGNTAAPACTKSRVFRHVRLLMKANEHAASTFQKAPMPLALEQCGRRQDLKSCRRTKRASGAGFTTHMLNAHPM
ncbi:hypothetical protein [Bradyrhizobium liaoningense]